MHMVRQVIVFDAADLHAESAFWAGILGGHVFRDDRFHSVIDAFARKVPAGDNPWGAGATTLEWTLSSPPPFHQFEVLPRVQ